MCHRISFVVPPATTAVLNVRMCAILMEGCLRRGTSRQVVENVTNDEQTKQRLMLVVF